MSDFPAPSRRTILISISAVLGIAAISSLTYLYISDNKRTSRRQQFRSLQKGLHSQLLKTKDTLDDLVENDLRLIQIRIKTLRTHRLYPGDDHVKLPSLGLISEEDKVDLGADLIEETKEELIRERTLGFEDHAKVRGGYKQVDLLVKALRKQLGRLLEKVDALDLSELAEVGEEADQARETTMMTTIFTKDKDENEPTAIQALDKVRIHRRSVLSDLQKIIAQLDRIQASYQDRLNAVKAYERVERVGLEPTDNVEPTVDSEMMKHARDLGADR
ncbi:hypothetical protein B0O80DRAFT_424834 [Mortierella sp. GBAus27b]|nr:hypothetical protein B0O80DRAFT_424834 [Mortierella sp. GBAus27b]